MAKKPLTLLPLASLEKARTKEGKSNTFGHTTRSSLCLKSH